jgi:hypothetical protein
MAGCFQAPSKAQLKAFLGQTRAAAAGLTHPMGAIDLTTTYRSNVRADRDAVLPGFGEGAFSRDPSGALAAFCQFCYSQFGQRQSFTIWFLPTHLPIPEPCPRPRPCRTCCQGLPRPIRQQSQCQSLIAGAWARVVWLALVYIRTRDVSLCRAGIDDSKAAAAGCPIG